MCKNHPHTCVLYATTQLTSLVADRESTMGDLQHATLQRGQVEGERLTHHGRTLHLRHCRLLVITMLRTV
jgi:hypothetical protein